MPNANANIAKIYKPFDFDGIKNARSGFLRSRFSFNSMVGEILLERATRSVTHHTLGRRDEDGTGIEPA